MDIAVVVLALLVVGLVLLLARGAGGRNTIAPGTMTAPVLTAEVKAVVDAALTSALHQLADQSRGDREEIARMANDLVRTATDRLNEVNEATLGSTKNEINTTLHAVNQQITGRITELSTELHRLREVNNGQYTSVEKAVEALARRTENLKEVLSSAQKRGQWGERVAEDMLRAVGFIEGINYDKQTTNLEGGRPDYCFYMPPGRVLFMDVKFPLDKYEQHVSSEDEVIRSRSRAEFVAAVKGHVSALAKRNYVLNANEEAIDYVLMFVPNESISGFVHEADPTLIDWALDKKVVMCSPLTLYAFLVVIRQATDSFHTEQTAASIMQQINKFQAEWQKYGAAVDNVQASFKSLQEDIESIAQGGTRYRKLAVPVREIEKMRKNQGVPALDASPSPHPNDADTSE